MSIKLLGRDCLYSVFSWLKPKEVLHCREVNKTFNKLILVDPRWKKLANDIKDRFVKVMRHDSDNADYLPILRKFCEVVHKYFPEFSPSGKVDIMNNLKEANALIETKKSSSLENSLQRNFRISCDRDSAEMVCSLEEMRIIGYTPNFFYIQTKLDDAMRLNPREAPAILEKMSLAKCPTDPDTIVTTAFSQCPSLVPQMLALLHVEQDNVQGVSTRWLELAMIERPEYVPLFIQAILAMQTRGMIPPIDYDASIVTANRLCPQHIPMILSAMRAGGKKPSAASLKIVHKHFPSL